MRLLVGGLRSLPAVRPPRDFASRVLARWERERHEPLTAEILGLTTVVPGNPQSAGRSQPPLSAPAALRPSYPACTPAARRSAFATRSFKGLAAAVLAVIFVVGLVTGRSFNSPGAVRTAALVPNLLNEAVDLSLEAPLKHTRPTVNPTECPGPYNQWNPSVLRMVVRPPLQRDLQQVEVAVWVPEDMQIDFNADHYSSRQILVIPARTGEDGQWEAPLRWRALRPGRFDSWVETRCDGVYQRRAITFCAAER